MSRLVEFHIDGRKLGIDPWLSEIIEEVSDGTILHCYKGKNILVDEKYSVVKNRLLKAREVEEKVSDE